MYHESLVAQAIDLLVFWGPTIVVGLLFLYSFIREPRRFRNALMLFVFLILLLGSISIQFKTSMFVFAIMIAVAMFPVVGVLYLFVNGLALIRRSGFSLANALPLLLSLLIVGTFALPFVLAYHDAPSWTFLLAACLWAEAFWAAFTFVSLGVYSWLYRSLPRKTRYDYILIHGAGLNGTRPTPLLAGRIDKAVDVWRSQDCKPRFVASGGKGLDEVVSEAEAIRDYLISDCGVPANAILLESRSVNTWENLANSKEIMDKLSASSHYSCCLVTSDFHVFRAVEYARKMGLTADGVGSTTPAYYAMAAFIREYVAITRAHWWPYALIAAMFAVMAAYILLGRLPEGIFGWA